MASHNLLKSTLNMNEDLINLFAIGALVGAWIGWKIGKHL
jgi:hypothetical protein